MNDCGCRQWYTPARGYAHDYCPKHAAVDRLVEALRGLRDATQKALDTDTGEAWLLVGIAATTADDLLAEIEEASR